MIIFLEDLKILIKHQILKIKFIYTTGYVHYILIFNEDNVLIRIFY